MFAVRRSLALRLGLWSTALYTTSSRRAKQTGTMCGRPCALTVARRPTRAASTAVRIAAASMTARYARPPVRWSSVDKLSARVPTARLRNGHTRAMTHGRSNQRRPSGGGFLRWVELVEVDSSPSGCPFSGGRVSQLQIQHARHPFRPWRVRATGTRNRQAAQRVLPARRVLLQRRHRGRPARCPEALWRKPARPLPRRVVSRPGRPLVRSRWPVPDGRTGGGAVGAWLPGDADADRRPRPRRVPVRRCHSLTDPAGRTERTHPADRRRWHHP